MDNTTKDKGTLWEYIHVRYVEIEGELKTAEDNQDSNHEK